MKILGIPFLGIGDCSLHLVWNEVHKYLRLPRRESSKGDGKSWLKRQVSTAEERAGKKEQSTLVQKVAGKQGGGREKFWRETQLTKETALNEK